MGGVRLWVRHELRHRWVSLLLLAMVVALASGTVATAFAGAIRGGTALDRLVEQTRAFNAVIPANPQIQYPWSEFDQLPYVEARAGLAAIAGARPLDVQPQGDDWLTTPTDDQWFRTIDVPVVLDGRPYDPNTPDELVITPEFADAHGLAVGDTLRVQLPDASQAARAVRRQEPVQDPHGPVVGWRVVGVVRSVWMTADAAEPDGQAALSPATLTAYSDNLLGGAPLSRMTVISIFRLDDPARDIAALTKDARRLTGQTDVDVWDTEVKYNRPARDNIRFEARTLAAFGLVALVAAGFLVGGLVARTAAAGIERLAPGPALGMSPGQVVGAATVPAALAAVVGAVLGVTGAWIASQWFPVGSARRYEPGPGRDLDPVVLSAVLAAAALFLTFVAVAASWRRAVRRRGEHAPRVSKVAAWFTQVSAPVPVVLGTRLALEPQRGKDAVPVRPAQIGAIAAAAGCVAALVFAHGIDDAITHPVRFGQIQQAETFVGFGGQDYGDPGKLLDQVRSLPYVDGVLDARQGNATADDDRLPMVVYSGGSGPKAMGPVVTHGRAPAATDEVMLGTVTADALGVGVGDQVSLTGSAATRSYQVVGTGFLPPGAHNGYTDGAWVVASSYPLLFDDFHFHTLLVASDSLSSDTLIKRLDADTGADFGPPQPVDAVQNLRSVRRFPAVLAAFLALLGIGVVGNALVLAVRRREGDLAVVRALGMTGGQAAATVAVQALTFVTVGLLYGAPLGLVLGRALWRTVAETLPLQFVPPTSMSAVLWVVGASLGLTVLLAVLPARRAARIPLAAVLRAE
ncbi:ABC transporter permease [Nocardioides panacisoli]|uniref:ABC3 transporter permease C-terminal domain-containing protein n=1 Tax=Nocardioides panacisoli TaxID=627624 RepID=A0ABP7J4B4_9ACTN